MKLVKKSLRAWLTVASLFSFLGGWIILAHSNKPAPLQVGQPSISTQPSNSSSTNNSVEQFLQNLNQNSSSSSNGFAPFVSQPSSSFSPRMRTGGS